MKSIATCSPFDAEVASPGEIASLASKFHQDTNSGDGHEREYRLCAEYMLAQKQLIECQINALHRQENVAHSLGFPSPD
jgi:hypothetical protein